jgi:hypothetical protein
MRAVLLSLLLVAAPALALNEGLQCVPYARALSGVEIRGDAHTWWGQAEGKYARGQRPKVGAVLAFEPHGKMRLGHVAAVRRIIDDRTILISHANWSTIDGTRGHIEQDVRAVDVSEAGDWSAVRVWYTPNAALGSTQWPAHGFIYPNAKRSDSEAKQAVASLLGGKMPASAAVQLAVVRPEVARPGKAGFGLSSSLLSDIDRKAAKETKGKAFAIATKRDPIADIMAKLGR